MSMAVSDRMVLLVRALAVFAIDALLGLAAIGSVGCGGRESRSAGWCR